MQLLEKAFDKQKDIIGEYYTKVIKMFPWFLNALINLGIENTLTFKDKLRIQLRNKFAQFKTNTFEDKKSFVAFFIYLLCKEIREKGFHDKAPGSLNEIYDLIAIKETKDIVIEITNINRENSINEIQNPENLYCSDDEVETLYDLVIVLMK